MQVRGLFKGLQERDMDPDPIGQFRTWFAQAEQAGIYLPESMTIATATTEGKPSARVMLLKGVDADGFRFYTNYESRKGQLLTKNPSVAAVLHWPVLHRQVRIEGVVENRKPHRIQQAFIDFGAIQCGFCTPGMILVAKALLEKASEPSEEEIRKAISGNLCRCTGYAKIVKAIQAASQPWYFIPERG